MGWLKEKIQQHVLESIDITTEISDEELLSTIDEILVLKVEGVYQYAGKKKATEDIFNSIRRLDVLQDI